MRATLEDISAAPRERQQRGSGRHDRGKRGVRSRTLKETSEGEAGEVTGCRKRACKRRTPCRTCFFVLRLRKGTPRWADDPVWKQGGSPWLGSRGRSGLPPQTDIRRQEYGAGRVQK